MKKCYLQDDFLPQYSNIIRNDEIIEIYHIDKSRIELKMEIFKTTVLMVW
jgi:hypothetical protein